MRANIPPGVPEDVQNGRNPDRRPAHSTSKRISHTVAYWGNRPAPVPRCRRCRKAAAASAPSTRPTSRALRRRPCFPAAPASRIPNLDRGTAATGSSGLTTTLRFPVSQSDYRRRIGGDEASPRLNQPDVCFIRVRRRWCRHRSRPGTCVGTAVGGRDSCPASAGIASGVWGAASTRGVVCSTAGGAS